MQGLIKVKEYTSAAEMRAAAAALHRRLVQPPKRQAEPTETRRRVDVATPGQIKEIYKIVQFRRLVQQDAHVYDRYKYLALNPDILQRAVQNAVDAAFEADERLTSGGRRVRAIPMIKEMCSIYGVTYKDMCSSRRTQDVVFPRQKMMWVVKNRTGFSFPEIGRKFGGRDHTTVLHAVRKIDRLLAAGDPRVAELKEWVSDD